MTHIERVSLASLQGVKVRQAEAEYIERSAAYGMLKLDALDGAVSRFRMGALRHEYMAARRYFEDMLRIQYALGGAA